MGEEAPAPSAQQPVAHRTRNKRASELRKLFDEEQARVNEMSLEEFTECFEELRAACAMTAEERAMHDEDEDGEIIVTMKQKRPLKQKLKVRVVRNVFRWDLTVWRRDSRMSSCRAVLSNALRAWDVCGTTNSQVT